MNLEKLETWLESGGGAVGQITVANGTDGYELRHTDDDQGTDSLQVYQNWEDAHEICKLDNEGEYRPLKSASNLRTGWLMKLGSAEEVLAALDIFYPAAIGMWVNESLGRLRVNSMMETLGRQTGMYRFAKSISEDGRRGVVQERCEKSCLRRILWEEGAHVKRADLGERDIPIYCPEICSLLVADSRIVARAEHQAVQNS